MSDHTTAGWLGAEDLIVHSCEDHLEEIMAVDHHKAIDIAMRCDGECYLDEASA